MKEVLDYYMSKIEASNALESLSLTSNRYILVSTHREENVDNPRNLKKILCVLNLLAEEYDIPIVVSTHPRTRIRIGLLEDQKLDSRIQFMKPFGFIDYVKLQMNALCTVSDSGTISEESSILNFPAISLRQSMERPEAQDAGTIILTGFDPQVVLDSIQVVIHEHTIRKYPHIAQDYTITDTSWRVLKLILGNAGLSNLWWGVR
jgi:UDP-N-acetylglucosamine 2-epimerase (non-hydrolysing)